MGFKSVNEIEKFKFTDCVITKREKKNDEISYEVEALIIASDNSQNSNCTESYAGTAYIRFISGEEILCIKDGYKKYDCDNKLIEEVPDEKVDSVTMENLLKHCENFYLSGIEKIPDGEDYVLFMDADLSTDLSAIDEVIKHMGESQIIIGSRHMKNSKILTYQPLKRIVIGYGCRILVELKFHFHSTDTQCGFKAFKTDLAKKIITKQIINGFAFDVEYLYIAKLNGYNFVEIPVIWKNDRTSTVSKGASKKFFKDMGLMKKNRHNYLF